MTTNSETAEGGGVLAQQGVHITNVLQRPKNGKS